MHHLKTAVSALLVGLLLLMATDYLAMAATGKTLVLGKANKARKTTTIKATRGPALKLTTKSGQPPLKVNRTTRVTNLNADYVDGKSASSFGVRTRVYALAGQVEGTGIFQAATPTIPRGYYLLTVSGFMKFPAGEFGECTVGVESSTTDYFIDQMIPPDPQGRASLNATTAISLSSSQPILLTCLSNFSGLAEISNVSPLRISLTAIDSRSTGTLTPVP
ncbi:MAG: hypothetical protein ACRCYU_16325 [Nocardioides sp.]